MRKLPWFSILQTGMLIGIIANVIYLNYVVFLGQQNITTLAKNIESSKVSQPISQEQKTCSSVCLQEIKTATESLQLAKPTVAPKPVAKTTVIRGPKDYYIPLGTGYTEKNEWVDVSGTDTTIDPATYGKINTAVFEASMHIPVANGTMYARLYNVTDKHPVWFSEVSTSKGTSTTVTSGNITLDPGSKLYRVQIKTSLQYPSYLDFSRIRITIE